MLSSWGTSGLTLSCWSGRVTRFRCGVLLISDQATLGTPSQPGDHPSQETIPARRPREDLIPFSDPWVGVLALAGSFRPASSQGRGLTKSWCLRRGCGR